MLQLAIPELPEQISVETRFISREVAAMQMANSATNLNASSQMSSIQTNLNSENVQLPELIKITPARPMTAVPPKKFSVEVMTEANPTRNRLTQTDPRNESTIGIQCNLDKEIEEMEFNEAFDVTATETPDENLTEIKKQFTDFVKNKTQQYTNGNIECLQCGEIKKNSKTMEAHMALHWGPSILCFRCGINFEHKLFWKQHKCEKNSTSRNQRIKCPLYFCAADAISTGELYDHLNEHSGTFEYQCKNCTKKFTTAGELRCHIELKKKCRTANRNTTPNSLYGLSVANSKYRKRVFISQNSKGKRFIGKKFLSRIALNQGAGASRMCSVCLKRCKNSLQYRRHLKFCLEQHKQRLHNKRLEEYPIKDTLTNGIH